MKKIIFFFFIGMYICQIAQADKLGIPFQCYPKELQAEFAKHGAKLDLNGSERTTDSWGYIENLGNSFDIITYHTPTPEQLNLIWEITRKVINDQKQKE